jgi:hypothetical protein
MAPNVPTAYPSTANNTPTGAKEGLKADATTGAMLCAELMRAVNIGG